MYNIIWGEITPVAALNSSSNDFNMIVKSIVHFTSCFDVLRYWFDENAFKQITRRTYATKPIYVLSDNKWRYKVSVYSLLPPLNQRKDHHFVWKTLLKSIGYLLCHRRRYVWTKKNKIGAVEQEWDRFWNTSFSFLLT